MSNTNEIVEQRVALYGDPVQTFARIAEVWTGILGVTVNPAEVPLLLAGMKLVRTQVTPDYADNSDDVDGYMDIFRQVVGEDMVQARTPDAYWAQKNPKVPELCVYCEEPERFHEPVQLACVRPGRTGSTFHVDG